MRSNSRQTLYHFIAVFWQFRKDALLSGFIAVQAFCNSTLVPFWIGKILATLGRPGQNTNQIVFYLVVTMAVGVISNYIGFKSLFVLQPKAMAFLEREALQTLLNRSVGFHNNHIAGKLMTDGTQYPMAFIQLSNALFITLLQFAVGIITGIALIAFHSLLLGVAVLAMTMSVLGVVAYQTIRSGPDREQRHEARRQMMSNMADTISNAVTVKTFAREQAELKSHHLLSVPLSSFRTRDWTRLASDGSKRIAVLMAFQIVFILLIIRLVSSNPALLGIGIFTFSYAITLASRLFDIGSVIRTIEDALLDASDMTRYINEAPEIVDKQGATALKVRQGIISFDAIAFKYADNNASEKVFSNLSVNIPAGQKVGLVGPSGGGKSTLTRLLLRFEDIQSGTISIDGQDITQVTQSSLREAISYVPQEPLLFHRTILENISYGIGSADFTAVVSACKKASALAFIEALPDGFNTVVGERGVKLSGGQRQRIAIARALLKDAPLLVLDEATSALDSDSEAAIQKALKTLMQNRTTLVIAHRLSTIQRLDRILVLADGKIIEDGKHHDLLAEKGLYSRLWAHQSGGFIED